MGFCSKLFGNRHLQELRSNRWVSLLLIIVTLQYGWSLFKSLKNHLASVKPNEIPFYNMDLLTSFNLIFFACILFLVYKRSELGWIILLGKCLFTVLTSISGYVLYNHFPEMFKTGMLDMACDLLITVIVAVLLFQPGVASYFYISDRRRTRYFAIAFGIFLFMIVGTRFFLQPIKLH